MQSWRRNLAISFFSAALCLLILQLFLYRQYAVEMTYLYGRDLIDAEPRDTYRRMAAICNSLKRKNCAIRNFNRLLEMQPNDVSALSNLGMNLAMQSKFKAALPYLRAYIAADGQGSDVFYWYGKTLQAIGDGREAIKIFYQALNYREVQVDTVRTIFAILEEEDRYLEALSFIHSLRRLQVEPEVKELVDEKNLMLAKKVRQDELKLRAVQELRFPSFDGQRYSLPLRSNSTDLTLIDVVDARTANRIDEQKLQELQMSYQTVGRNRVRVPKLSILGQSLSHVDFELCAGCGLQLRRDALEGLSPRIEIRPALSFLVLQPRPN